MAEVPTRAIEAADGDRVTSGTAWYVRALFKGQSRPPSPAVGKFPIATVDSATR